MLERLLTRGVSHTPGSRAHGELDLVYGGEELTRMAKKSEGLRSYVVPHPPGHGSCPDSR
jgi:hypothetical protein